MSDAAQADPTTQTAVGSAAAQLDALLAHASQLPSELDRVWSGALSQESVQEALRSLLVRLEAAFSVFDESMTGAGEDPRLATDIPLSPADWEQVAASRVSPSELRDLAQVIAFGLAAQAMATLQAPSMKTLNLMTNEVEDVWTADAFGRLRYGLGLLRRLLRAEPDDAFSAITRWFDLSQRAANAGMPEAAVLYLRLALPPLSQLLEEGTPIGRPTDQTTASLDSIGAALGEPSLGSVLRLVERLVRDMAEGKAPDLPTATLLAVDLSDRLVGLVNEQILGGGTS